MKKLIVEEKTGFSTKLPFTILDSRGTLFYSSDFVKMNDTLKFNLPPGTYYYDGFFIKLNKPVSHNEIKLPRPQRKLTHKRYLIRFGKNRNKCTVYHKPGLILFDEAFRNAPVYLTYYIFYHEIGHSYYKDEHLADLYATKKMLEKGFNKSQIERAVHFSLSENSNYRKIKTSYELLKSVNK